MSETKLVRPAAGVSLYTGMGHAPFGQDHTIALPRDHVAQLGDRVAAPVPELPHPPPPPKPDPEVPHAA